VLRRQHDPLGVRVDVLPKPGDSAVAVSGAYGPRVPEATVHPQQTFAPGGAEIPPPKRLIKRPDVAMLKPILLDAPA
jgi:hypothetical protein